MRCVPSSQRAFTSLILPITSYQVPNRHMFNVRLRARGSRLLAAYALAVGFPVAVSAADFIRGDCNSDNAVNISDPVFLLVFQFSGGSDPTCMSACDADDDASLVITDAIYLLLRLFSSGPPPPAPFPDCGPDPTPDALGCVGPTPCPVEPVSVPGIVRTSPVDGESGVAVTRETIIEFGTPLAEIGDGAARALFRGEELVVRQHVSPDRRVLTLFYPELLPASARVQVEVNGDELRTDEGLALDVDADGRPGGILVLEFDTLSTSRFPGTHICGRVFASELAPSEDGAMDLNTPLAGVRITVDGLDEAFAVTDALGNFRLEDAPAGRFFVHIDGTAATNDVPEGAYYPRVGKAWVSSPGVETSVGEIYLPLVEAGTLVEVSEDDDTVIEFPETIREEFPEFADVSITVPADSLFSDDGTRGGMVGIAPVSPDRLPGQLPPGLSFPLVITVQTDGATNFDRPVAVCFPNLPDPDTGETLPPDAKTALWSFNHDTGRFEIVGSMTVSDDGRLVCSDPGVGILAPGWHGVAPGSGGPGDCPDSENCEFEDDEDPPCEACICPPPPAQPIMQAVREGMRRARGLTDPVRLYSGEFYIEKEDLRIPGRGFDFVWARKYRSQRGNSSEQGNRWDFSYNVSLRVTVIEGFGTFVVLEDGNGRRDEFESNSDEIKQLSRSGFLFDILLGEDEDDTSIVRFSDGGRWEFDAGDEGRISRSVDRNRNEMSFHYDIEGRLVRIRDTLDRDIRVAYNAQGLIASVTDFIGRAVRYEYYRDGEAGGRAGDLKSVTRPAVVGTPNGNDFPNGKTTTFTYDGRSRLLTATDGRRNDPNDPTFGAGPFLVNRYGPQGVTRQIWGGDVVDLHYIPQEPTPENGYRIMRTIVNDRNGNVKEFFYRRGNQLQQLWEYTGRANPREPTTATANRPNGKLRAGDPDQYVTRATFNRDNRPISFGLPNGNSVSMIYAGSGRLAGNIRSRRTNAGGHAPRGDHAVLEETFEYFEDLGDCCGEAGSFVTRHVDARGEATRHIYDSRGNRVRTFYRDGTVFDDYAYNRFGQVTTRVHPHNGSGVRRRDEYVYHEDGPQRGYLFQIILDSENERLTYILEHDAVGNLIRLIDPRGDEVRFVVNALNQVVRVVTPSVDEAGTRYSYDFAYDANDNLKRLDIENRDASGRLQANTHFTTTYEYEILNQLVREADEVDTDHSVVTEYAYDGNRNRTLVRMGEATNGNQPANTVRYVYDERDLLFQTIRAEGDPNQSTTQLDYDGNRNLVRRTEGLESEEDPRVTDYVFDGQDRLVERIDALGNVTTYTYDENHNLVHFAHEGELQDDRGRSDNLLLYEESRRYDALDRITERAVRFFDTEVQQDIGDGWATTTFEYARDSQIVRVVNDNGNETRVNYDSVNRVQAIVDALANTRTFVYDRDSNIASIVEVDRSDLARPAEVFRTDYVYDGFDRLVRMSDNVGNTSTFGYDSRNNPTLSIDALDNVVHLRYDGLSRLISMTRVLTEDGTGATPMRDSITTMQSWDDSGRLVEQVDDNGNVTAYAYDALDRPARVVYADETETEYVRDVHGNVTSIVDANGTVWTTSYDALNRLVRADVVPGAAVSDETTFLQFAYDGLSRVVRAEDDDSVVTTGYDSLSSVMRDTLQGFTTSALYDGLGNQTVLRYPSGRTLDIAHDGLERMKVVRDAGALVAAYEYLGPDRIERRVLGNGTRTDFTYDGVIDVPNPAGDFGSHLPVRSTHTRTANSAVIDDRSYLWDRARNQIARADVRAGGPELEESFLYDSVYRLAVSERNSNGGLSGALSYTLDGVGNRTDVSGGADGGTYSMDATLPEPGDASCNQYTRTPFDTRVYDANGNLRSVAGVGIDRQYTYDAFDQLVSSSDSTSGVDATYKYDALGRRIERVVDAGSPSSTRYYYLSWQVVEERGDSDVPTTYAYGTYIDDVVQMRRDGADTYYHADAQLNVTALSDAAGNVVERYEYDDFGVPSTFDPGGGPRTESVVGNPYLFTGRRRDPESGLYYYRTRYLDPRAGRFTTRDTIGVWGDPGNLGSALAYVGNNPRTSVDPFGFGPGISGGSSTSARRAAAKGPIPRTSFIMPGDMIVRPKGELQTLRGPKLRPRRPGWRIPKVPPRPIVPAGPRAPSPIPPVTPSPPAPRAPVANVPPPPPAPMETPKTPPRRGIRIPVPSLASVGRFGLRLAGNIGGGVFAVAGVLHIAKPCDTANGILAFARLNAGGMSNKHADRLMKKIDKY